MSVFFYPTYKLVLLKDWRLGVLYYTLAALALLYIVVEIFVKKGYMDFDTNPHGTIKLILSDDFSNKNVSIPGNFPYCQGNTPCQYLDPWDLNWPSESRAVSITTFAKDRIQRRAQDGSFDDKFSADTEKVYFTQGPENVVIKVDHAVVATKFTDFNGRQHLAASHRQLMGYLMDTNGNVIRMVSSPSKGKADRLTLSELLSAAGVESLDQMSDIVDARGRSFRQRGCILKVTIFYQNWMSAWMGTTDVEYRYHVNRMPYVDYSSKQMIPLVSKEEVLAEVGLHQAEWRLQRKRYAVRVEFEQAGTLGTFSLSTLIVKLMSGVTILTLIATITDVLALYVLPNRSTYKALVYEESPILKTLRKRDKLDEKQDKLE